MLSYLENYRSRVGNWAGRFSWRGVSRRGDANATTGDCLGLTVLSSMILAVLLMRLINKISLFATSRKEMCQLLRKLRC